MPPVIGVSCMATQASWGSRTRPAVLLPETYVDALRRTGSIPVLLPAAGDALAADVARRVDALVLSGGADADPARYGSSPHAATVADEPERERWEFALLGAALGADLPVLGICRGAQLLNVARGGALVQHLPDVLGHDGHLPGHTRYGNQRLHTAPESILGRALGGSVDVWCHHHQGFGRLGAGVRAVAWAGDDIAEAIEVEGHRFAVGAQWHPEHSGDDRLYAALAEATR